MLCGHCKGFRNLFIMQVITETPKHKSKPVWATCPFCEGIGIITFVDDKVIPQKSSGPETIMMKWNNKEKPSKEIQKLFDKLDEYL